MIIKKHQLLLATLVLALAAAVFVNWYYTKPSKAESASAPTVTQAGDAAANLGDARYVIATDVTVKESQKDDFFAAARLRRRSAHDEATEVLNDVIKDPASAESAVKEASSKLQEIADALVLEGEIENLITAKIKSECLVFLDGDLAEVIVPRGTIDDVAVVKIREICMNHADCNAESVTITEYGE